MNEEHAVVAIGLRGAGAANPPGSGPSVASFGRLLRGQLAGDGQPRAPASTAGGAARILVIDDEPQVLATVARGLQRAGHEVAVARTAGEGIAAVGRGPDVILLDLCLPDLDGIEVLCRLRGFTSVPVLLLSGAGTERRRVAALDAGADDFVDKPFSMEELRARVGAAFRRGANGETSGERMAMIRCGALQIDLRAHRLEVAEEPRRLTPTEWRLLTALVSRPGRLLSHRELIMAVWGSAYGDEARVSLRAHLRSLRAKLDDRASSPRYIATEPAAGYRWIGDVTR